MGKCPAYSRIGAATAPAVAKAGAVAPPAAAAHQVRRTLAAHCCVSLYKPARQAALAIPSPYHSAGAIGLLLSYQEIAVWNGEQSQPGIII